MQSISLWAVFGPVKDFAKVSYQIFYHQTLDLFAAALVGTIDMWKFVYISAVPSWWVWANKFTYVPLLRIACCSGAAWQRLSEAFAQLYAHMYRTSPSVHPASQALDLNIPQPTLRLQVFLYFPSHPAPRLKEQYGLKAVGLADVWWCSFTSVCLSRCACVCVCKRVFFFQPSG